MITVHMMGNIGNQLFIYAFARALQLEYNQQMLIDLKGLKRGYYSANYKLDQFALNDNIVYNLSKLGLLQRLKYMLSSNLYHIQHYYYRYRKHQMFHPASICAYWEKRGCYYNTNHDHFDYGHNEQRNKYVYGYFQCAKYFQKYEEQIRKDLKVTTPMNDYEKEIIGKMLSENSVAISIRASKAFDNPKVTDNLNLGFIDKDFYYRGMEEIAKRVKNPSFYIFADDMEIVKKEYEFPFPVTYVTPPDSATGIRLMYSCKHFIITNSTFAWWGAYLGEYPQKIVVMPDVWDRFGPLRNEIYDGFTNPIKLSVNFLTE